jgi:hypothetical protein
MTDIVKQICKEFETLRKDRLTWNQMYQVLGEYVSQMKQNFTSEPTQGQFLINEVYDSTAIFAAHSASSALLGMMYSGTAQRTFKIMPPDNMEVTTELAEFYSMMTQKTIEAFDDPAANLTLALDEYMLDQIIFGTSGIGCERGTRSKLLFKPYGIKEVYFEEGRDGVADSIYIFYEWSVARVVAEFGIDKVSDKVRKAHEQNKDEKVKILHCIKPRTEKKAEAGKLAMPFMSVKLEFDKKHLLEESGFDEQPIYIGRFRKLNYERMGRSPAMSAIADIREANALREAVIRAIEKQLDPPLGVLDDGMLGGSVIDTSPRAINVFNAGANPTGERPIFPLFTVGDMNPALSRLEDLKQIISQHFFIDRLLDFSSNTEMTFGEVQIRDQIRTASLSGLFSRQYSEVLTRVFARGINILWRAGEFGVIQGSDEEKDLVDRGIEPIYLPDAIIQRLEEGKDVYKIVYQTKAASAQRTEEYMATIEMLGQFRQDVQLYPQLRNRIDLGRAYKQMAQIRGIGGGIVREDDAVEQLDQADAQAAQQAQMLAAGEQAAGIAEKAARAENLGRQE